MAHIDINPVQKVWLDYENYSTIPHVANTGRFGQYNRQGSNGYVDETFLKFDMSPISGTVTNATIDLTCTFKGVQYWQTTIYLYEQDKTDPNTITFPYKFNDFANSAWGTQANSLLSSFIGGDQVGVLSFPSNQTFTNLVQKWVNNSSLNWGFVVAANLGFFDAYLTVDEAVLRVDYQDNWIHTHRRSKKTMDLRANTQQTILTEVFASSANTAIIQDTLTLTASDIRISKNGGVISTPSISGSITHAYSGKYYITLTSAAFNTPGTLDVMINKSGSMPVDMKYNILPEAKYDALYASGTFDVNVTKVAGSSQATISTQSSIDAVKADTASTITKVDAVKGDTASAITKIDNVQTTATDTYDIVDQISDGTIVVGSDVTSIKGVLLDDGATMPSDLININGDSVVGGNWVMQGKRLILQSPEGAALDLYGESADSPTLRITNTNANGSAVGIFNTGTDNGTSTGKAIEVISSSGGSAINIETNSTNVDRLTTHLHPTVSIVSNTNNGHAVHIDSISERKSEEFNHYQSGIRVDSDVEQSPTVLYRNETYHPSFNRTFNAGEHTVQTETTYQALPSGHKQISSLALTDLIDGVQIDQLLKILLAKADGDWVLDESDPSIVRYKARDHSTTVTSIKITDTGRTRV